MHQKTSNEALFYLIRNDVNTKSAKWFITGNISVYQM